MSDKAPPEERKKLLKVQYKSDDTTVMNMNTSNQEDRMDYIDPEEQEIASIMEDMARIERMDAKNAAMKIKFAGYYNLTKVLAQGEAATRKQA